MISRRLNSHLNELLRHSPAVVLFGPRQVGKTTLALEIGEKTASIYLDLEDENDRAKLANPSKYLADHEDELVILDEVHRVATWREEANRQRLSKAEQDLMAPAFE